MAGMDSTASAQLIRTDVWNAELKDILLDTRLPRNTSIG